MGQRNRIAILLFDGVNAVDVSGPAEAFTIARDSAGKAAYFIETWGVGGLEFRTESNLKLVADAQLDDTAPCDMLVIPGGRGARLKDVVDLLAPWLRDNGHRFGRIVSICTGAYPLAHSGLVEGRTLTTHWAHGADLHACYPAITVETDHLFLRDGKFYSSGGVASGIDLALEIIREDLGHKAAMDVAREMVVFLRRDGGQSQFSQLLQLQSKPSDPIQEACHWAAANLHADLSNDVLAEKARLSVRQFTRRFVASVGEPPATHVNRIRIEAAKSALSHGANVAQTAHAVGFETTDGFRRSFEKLVGITPHQFQARFGKAEEVL
ncbi:MAG: DJ-1/PfpI family protein [Erythrobacter sp.]